MKFRIFTSVFTVTAALFLILFQTTAAATETQMQKGIKLSYLAIRGSTISTAHQTSNLTDTVLELNKTMMLYQRHYTTSDDDKKINITIKYMEGTPTFVTYLPALTYLPFQSLEKALQNDLEWTKNITTSQEWVQITGSSAETLNFTVQAGTFQCLNLTLIVTGWEAGRLSLVYDLASGILVYEIWITEYGEMIAQELISTELKVEKPPIVFNIFLFVTVTVTPTIISIDQARKKLFKNEKSRLNQNEKFTLKSGFPLKPFYAALIAASLALACTQLPWGQFEGWQIFLPLSLISPFTGSPPVLVFNPTIQTVSLLTYAAAIVAWITIAGYIYTTGKFMSELATVLSSIFIITSIILFLQSGLPPSWGLPLNATAAILLVTSMLAAKIKKE